MVLGIVPLGRCGDELGVGNGVVLGVLAGVGGGVAAGVGVDGGVICGGHAGDCDIDVKCCNLCITRAKHWYYSM